jgi:hypothetical protein
MSNGFQSWSVPRDASVSVDFPCLFPRSWHSAAEALSESPLPEILCGSMSLDCCHVFSPAWSWHMYEHEDTLYKKVFLWDNVVYQAPYDPEEKDMTEEEYRAHEAAAWEHVKSIPHPSHIGYASFEQKEDEKEKLRLKKWDEMQSRGWEEDEDEEEDEEEGGPVCSCCRVVA